MAETGTNREYRDRLFKFIFGNPQNKEWTLSLYNAVNGSHYTDASAIKLNTIENAVYMSMKNDVSFLIDNTANIPYGHTTQSSDKKCYIQKVALCFNIAMYFNKSYIKLKFDI